MHVKIFGAVHYTSGSACEKVQRGCLPTGMEVTQAFNSLIFSFFFHAILTAFQNLRRQRLSLPNFIDQILDQPCFLGNEHYLKHVPIHAVLPQIRRRELGSRLPTCHTPVTVLAGAEARWNNHCPRSTAATGINETRTRSHQGDGVQADGLLWGQWPERRSVAE